MRRGPSIATAWLGAALVAASWSPSLADAGQERRATLKDWDSALQEIRGQLDAGRWAEARTTASGLVDELVRRLGGGEDDAKLLAAAVTYRAIAEAALGEEDDAAWSWITAQNLDPAMRDAPLEGFGAIGELFARHRLRALGEGPAGISDLHAADDPVSPTAPVPIEVGPAMPPSKELERAWRHGPLEVEIVVDEAGTVLAPVVVEPEEQVIPGKVVLGLEAVRRWRFAPANAPEPRRARALRVEPFELPRSFLYGLAGRPKLQAIHELALTGRWAEADAAVRAALEAAPGDCLDGDGKALGDCDLGPLSLLRALTASGLGESDEAAWHRSVALAFSARFAEAPLEAYGEPGRALAGLPTACLFGPWESCPATPLRGRRPGITPPRKLAGVGPASEDSPARRAGARTILRTVIGTDGRPREPSVLASTDAVSGFLALRALSGWRFEPARRGGEPVAVVVELTMHPEPGVPAERVDSWRRRLGDLDRTLRSGDWNAAAPVAEGLAAEIAAETAHGGSDLLAEAVAAIALAAAGRGDRAAALWSWAIAQNLAYELRWADLSAYGEAGELLADHPLRRPGELADGTTAAPADLEFGSLRRVAGDDPVYPEGHSGAVPVVETILRDGRPESPVVLSLDHPAAVVAALRALQGWRLAPVSPRPTVRAMALPGRPTSGDPKPGPSFVRFARLASKALNSGDPAAAECYWSQIPYRVRGQLELVDGRTIVTRPVTGRWRLSHPPRRSAAAPPARSAGGAETAQSPVMVGGEVQAPVKISGRPAQYNETARKARVQGVVIVQTIIDREGNVRRAMVLKGLGMGLDEQAVEALCGWKFRPATLNGRPVEVYYNLTVSFIIQ